MYVFANNSLNNCIRNNYCPFLLSPKYICICNCLNIGIQIYLYSYLPPKFNPNKLVFIFQNNLESQCDNKERGPFFMAPPTPNGWRWCFQSKYKLCRNSQEILNLKGHQNCIAGFGVTEILPVCDKYSYSCLQIPIRLFIFVFVFALFCQTKYICIQIL